MNSQPSERSILQPGVLYAVGAYTSWGLLPLYWKLFSQIPAQEVLSHRILWSMVFLFGLLLFQRRLQEFVNVWRSPRHVGILLLTATILASNWGLYIYGVNTNRVVETSLGYYINPLVNVMLGFLFLKERLSRVQMVAVGLAAIGVTNFIAHVGTVPWIALALAFSFGFYGLVRKSAAIAPSTNSDKIGQPSNGGYLSASRIFMKRLSNFVIVHWTPDGWTDGRNTADYASGSSVDELLGSYWNQSLGAKWTADTPVHWLRRYHFHAVTLV